MIFMQAVVPLTPDNAAEKMLQLIPEDQARSCLKRRRGVLNECL
jgi:hypothetical protein